MRINHLEIRVDHARVKISDRLRLKAIRMKAKADGITVDQFCNLLSQETREYYRQKLFPTKLGPEEAYRDKNGIWKVDDPWEGSQPYTLQTVLESNLYTHIRAYLMGLILSETGKHERGDETGAIILRDDNTVAIVKHGRLELRSSDDWLRTLGKGKKKQTKDR